MPLAQYEHNRSQWKVSTMTEKQPLVCDRSRFCEVFFQKRTHLRLNGQRLYFSTPKHSSTLFIQPFTHRFFFFCTLCCQRCLHFTKQQMNSSLETERIQARIDQQPSQRETVFLSFVTERERNRERERPNAFNATVPLSTFPTE